MNIVNYEKLKEILQELWNRIKNQFIKSASLQGNTLKIEKENGNTIDVDLKPILRADNISYDNSNTALGLDKVQDVLEFLEKDKASLNKDNLFIGKNTFNEVILMGKTPFVGTKSSQATTTGHNTGIYCGYRMVSTGTSKYISAIKVKVIDSYVVGSNVDNVYVTEIKKVTDRTDDIVGETIVSNGSFIVEEDKDYGKCIYVPVQKEYTEDTYFIIGKKGTRALSECWYTSTQEIAECVNNLNIDALPAKDLELNHNNGNGWVVIHSLVTDDINVREALASTTALDGKVDKTDVGNEDNKIPRLENGKLVEKIIPEIAITRIIDVVNQAEALDKVNSGDIQVGDSVRLTGEQNKVYQYNGSTSGTFFGDRFIEISQGDATVKTINNGQPQNGNFQFELEETVDAIGLKVNNQTITSTPLATQVEINDLKNLLSF